MSFLHNDCLLVFCKFKVFHVINLDASSRMLSVGVCHCAVVTMICLHYGRFVFYYFARDHVIGVDDTSTKISIPILYVLNT